jgi:single-stranded-DNA-specific exonuclease
LRYTDAIWTAPIRDRQAEDSLMRELEIDRVSARMLVNRGHVDPEAALKFLDPQLAHLHDPFLLPDMDKAARRIADAVATGESIFIHGDYDVDGVTSTALYVRSLTALGAKPLYRVPHRKNDGYDLKVRSVDWAHSQGASLLITTDCGIQARDAVKHANELGITVVVTDHHEPGDELPPAYAVVNPHRRDSEYPFPNLAGVGVAFKTMQAVVRLIRPADERKFIERFLDLAACGTIADVMPLVSENRVFASYGLRELPKTRKVGLRALLQSVQGDGQRRLTSESISFGIAPRINAVGRLDDAALALELMLTTDQAEAERLVAALNDFNAERRDEQRRMVLEAIALLSTQDLSDVRVLVLASGGWNAGVVGIVAGKLAERYYRPAIVIGVDESGTHGKGSARSIPGFHLFDGIRACRGLLDSCGGHEMAAGLTLSMDRLDTFRNAINEYASQVLTPSDLLPKIRFDGVVDPSFFKFKQLELLERFEPFGDGNPEPRFASRNMQICDMRRIGKDQSHLRLKVRGESPYAVECVAWGGAERAESLRPGDRLDVLYSPQAHVFNGRHSLQLDIKDMRPSPAA